MENAVESVSLASLSPHDDKWRVGKTLSEIIAELLFGTMYHAHALRMMSCSENLTFTQSHNPETGELKLKLNQVYLCKVRHCPLCSRARSRVWKARLHEGIPKFVADYPTAKFILLTLTWLNIPITELRDSLNGSSKAFDRLMKRRGVKPYVLGYIRTMEVTRNAETGEVNAHYHVILAVTPNYYSRGYISQALWATMWQESLKVSYTPNVYVQAVKPNPNLVNDPTGLASSIMEVSKYCVKHTDMLHDRDWLVELTTQLHGTKHIVLGGLIKQYVNSSDPKEEDILKAANEDNELEPDIELDKMYFHWHKRESNYFLSNR